MRFRIRPKTTSGEGHMFVTAGAPREALEIAKAMVEAGFEGVIIFGADGEEYDLAAIQAEAEQPTDLGIAKEPDA